MPEQQDHFRQRQPQSVALYLQIYLWLTMLKPRIDYQSACELSKIHGKSQKLTNLQELFI